MVQINMNAPYILMQTVGQTMIRRGKGGKIINVSSMAGIRAQVKMSTYAATKAALAQLTASFANEFGPYNIQVNAILPG
jgi:2-deoxy-D-gluconate 3-dehydrogenase